VLTQGELVEDFITDDQPRYYYTIVDAHRRSQVVLQPSTNYFNLYVNLFDAELAGTNVNRWQRPNQNVHQFALTGLVMPEGVAFNVTTLTQKCPSSSCLVLSSVWCSETRCKYSITSSYDTVLLLDKVPFQDRVELQQEHLYQFYCDRNANILITLTALGGGDPDLYVSHKKVPNMQNSNWNSATWEGEALLIKSDDPYFKGKSMVGTYNVLVVGRTASLYSIVINLDQKHVVQLLQGQPQQGHLERYSENFYYNAYDQDLTVYLTPYYGDAFLRANPQHPIYDDLYSRLPRRKEGVWSSVQAGERNRLVVRRTDPKFCFNCNVLIGVFTNSTNSTYTIEASNDLFLAMLREGLPLRDDVQRQAWNYYLYS
jgi:hypothetical protein